MEFTRLESFMKEFEKEGPLGNLEVYVKGEKVYSYSFGFEQDGVTPFSRKSLFLMYSCTKVVTSVAAMRLVEEGKIGLDDPVYKYIPEYKDVCVGTEGNKAKNVLTIRHLFSMTGGFTYNFFTPNLMKAKEDKNATTSEIIKALAKDPLSFEPGTDFSYSVCLDVLAVVCEVVTGMRFSDYVKKCIFDPLGMNSCTFRLNEEIRKKILPIYRYDPDTDTISPSEVDDDFFLSDNYDSGGAGMIGNVEDYTKFAVAMANYGVSKDGYHLLSKESIDIMRTNQLNSKALKTFWKSTDGYGYGLGVRTLMDKSKSKGPVGEFGWDSAGCSYVMLDVDNNIAVFYGCHVLKWGPGYDAHSKIRDLVYEDLGLD